MNEESKRRGENFVGVIKAIVRDIMYEREEFNRVAIKDVVEEELNKIKHYSSEGDWPKDNAGGAWTIEEDFQLGEEWGRLISLIAQKHHRTFGAIRARIGHKIYGR